jgi:low temperature requirement protein LtrA
MTDSAQARPDRHRLVRRMLPRSPHEAHRTATPLELLFDLVFVVAVAQAGSALHHALGSGHVADGVIGYLMVFFAIWWAWMNFTWFASAYDCDDVPYRLLVFIQIVGALIMAAGIHDMFETRGPNIAVVGGYAVMRLALVAQWLRASGSAPDGGRAARRYAVGITVLQAAWVGMLFAPGWWTTGFLVFAALELAVPVWAEHSTPTTWHPHHITERYGLFTLIVLGESVLAATTAVQSALHAGYTEHLPATIAGGLLIVFSLWWIYFDRPMADQLTRFRRAVVWGYGHYVVFASAAAVGAGLAVAVDQLTGESALGVVAAGFAVAVPVSAYVVSIWVLHDRPEYGWSRAAGPFVALAILATPFSGHAALLTGLILAALIAAKALTGVSVAGTGAA